MHSGHSRLTLTGGDSLAATMRGGEGADIFSVILLYLLQEIISHGQRYVTLKLLYKTMRLHSHEHWPRARS